MVWGLLHHNMLWYGARNVLEVVLSSIALLLGLGALLAAVQAVREVRASAPKQVMDGFQSLTDRVQAAEENVGLMRSSLIQWEAQMGGVLEAVEDTLQQTERKRRRTQAAAQRAEQAEQASQGGNAGELSDAMLYERARAQGLL